MEQNLYNRGLGFPPFNTPAFGMGGFPYLGYNLSSTPEQINMPWPLTFGDKSTQYNLNELIGIIKKSIIEETKEVGEYEMLAKKAQSEEDKEIIYSIRDNERLHSQILAKIFTKLTGVVMPTENTEQIQNSMDTSMSYLDTLKKYWKGELEAVEKYRELLAYAPNKEIYDMLFYILTDEIKHAIKYEYLIIMNK